MHCLFFSATVTFAFAKRRQETALLSFEKIQNPFVGILTGHIGAVLLTNSDDLENVVCGTR